MIKPYYQNLMQTVYSLHSDTVGTHYPLGGDRGIVAATLRRMRGLLAEFDRRRRAEYENRKAIAHLRGLSDAQLSDIGIARPDIERAVRLGKDFV
ncbi:MAG: DUF1127 domain-containing protein [Gammaproteobacteria bacterium]|jgi:uncharacterized protein YjiS (DUF1127 family)